jgi:hypothetical protein
MRVTPGTIRSRPGPDRILRTGPPLRRRFFHAPPTFSVVRPDPVSIPGGSSFVFREKRESRIIPSLRIILHMGRKDDQSQGVRERCESGFPRLRRLPRTPGDTSLATFALMRSAISGISGEARPNPRERSPLVHCPTTIAAVVLQAFDFAGVFTYTCMDLKKSCACNVCLRSSNKPSRTPT